MLISFLPKSATAGVAMAVSSSLGGNPSLTAGLAVLAGIVGALVVTSFMNAMRIRDYAARGFAAGPSPTASARRGPSTSTGLLGPSPVSPWR